jgi:S-formylglutathione hydrolase FrmB
MSTSITVILPQETRAQIGMTGTVGGEEPPVLYLLHGLSDDDTTWTRRTSIERYVAPLGLAVVMPQVQRSFYCDEAHGNDYWTFLSEELPAVVGSLFRVSSRPSDTFVAGLSMGGYGALKWALRHPSRFAAAASLSGALDVVELQRKGRSDNLFENVFGERQVAGSGDDVFHLLRSATEPLPALYLACGTEDELYASNVAFQEVCQGASVPLTVNLRPGEHEWASGTPRSSASSSGSRSALLKHPESSRSHLSGSDPGRAGDRPRCGGRERVRDSEVSQESTRSDKEPT